MRKSYIVKTIGAAVLAAASVGCETTPNYDNSVIIRKGLSRTILGPSQDEINITEGRYRTSIKDCGIPISPLWTLTSQEEVDRVLEHHSE